MSAHHPTKVVHRARSRCPLLQSGIEVKLQSALPLRFVLAGHASFRGRRIGASLSCHKHWSDRVGVPCFRTRLWCAADICGFAPAPSSAPDELQRRAGFLVGDHIVRRAPPSRHCRTGCHQSTWREAQRQVCGRRRPLRVCGPYAGRAEHQSCAETRVCRGHS